VPYYAFFADLSTDAAGLNLWQGSDFANLIVRILERVPSIFKLDLNFVLFFVTYTEYSFFLRHRNI